MRSAHQYTMVFYTLQSSWKGSRPPKKTAETVTADFFFFATKRDRVKTENSQEETDSSQEMKSLSTLSYYLLKLRM